MRLMRIASVASASSESGSGFSAFPVEGEDRRDVVSAVSVPYDSFLVHGLVVAVTSILSPLTSPSSVILGSEPTTVNH
jgi:hypothetical protein